jgi:hypothetical protein
MTNVLCCHHNEMPRERLRQLGAELFPEDPFPLGRDEHGSGAGHMTRPSSYQAV